MTLSTSYSYRGESTNVFIPVPETGANPSFTNEAYHWMGARLALYSAENDWQVDVFVNNLTNERADYWHGTGNFEWQFSRTDEYDRYHRVWTNRPREFGVPLRQVVEIADRKARFSLARETPLTRGFSYRKTENAHLQYAA